MSDQTKLRQKNAAAERSVETNQIRHSLMLLGILQQQVSGVERL